LTGSAKLRKRHGREALEPNAVSALIADAVFSALDPKERFPDLFQFVAASTHDLISHFPAHIHARFASFVYAHHCGVLGRVLQGTTQVSPDVLFDRPLSLQKEHADLSDLFRCQTFGDHGSFLFPNIEWTIRESRSLVSAGLQHAETIDLGMLEDCARHYLSFSSTSGQPRKKRLDLEDAQPL
jgi:hypothetical protein